MIAVSVKDGDKIVDLLLQKGADINQTSMPSSPRNLSSNLLIILPIQITMAK